VGVALLLSLSGAAAGAQPAGDEPTFELAVPPPMGGEEIAFKADRIMFLHAEDGFETRLVKGAPYQAEAVTEVVQTLADGNRIVHKTSGSVYRDGEGRTRREGRLAAIGPLVASDDGPRSVFISDPAAGARYHLDLEERVAYKLPGARRLAGAEHAPDGAHERKHFMKKMKRHGRIASEDAAVEKEEKLGTHVVEGVEAEGTRTRAVIPAGEVGNERPIEIVSERWYSPELQVVVMKRHSDPRLGETTYKLQNISRGEPDRALFEVPADFKISDEPPQKRIRFRTREDRRD
jgi:hypothetical protein